MSSNEMPVEQARKVLGDLVASAQLSGKTTVITRYGRPAALIVPIPQETTVPTITMSDLRDQITASLTDQGEGVDVDAVAEAIRDRFGVVDIDSIASAEYWEIVRSHDATQADTETTYERTTDEGTDTITITVDGDEVRRTFLTDGTETGSDITTADKLHDYLVDITADGYREV